METTRNQSIDILKFIAVLLITNSHFDEQYTCCKELATGGAIGDVLFFFCSGYTLFLGRLGRLDTWYKRRVRRIYPSVIAMSICASLLYGVRYSLIDLFISGGDWFVSCIMIYYVLFYVIRRYFSDQLKWVYLGYIVFVGIWYLMFIEPIKSECLSIVPTLSNSWLFAIPAHGAWIYKWNYLKWGIYFLFFLMGAHVGKKEKESDSKKEYQLLPVSSLLIICIILFYGIQQLCAWYPQWESFQILSVVPLAGVCLLMYRMTETTTVLKLLQLKYFGRCITIIGGLCLEIYLVQPIVRTTSLNFLFPLNLVILFIAIVICAYVCRVVGRIFQQTFSSDDGYHWKTIVQL